MSKLLRLAARSFSPQSLCALLLAISPCVSRAAPPIAPTLEPDGITINAAGARAKIVRFGARQRDVVRALSFLGAPKIHMMDDCGQGAMSTAAWPNGLNAEFLNGRFSGWSIDPPNHASIPALVTAKGHIRLGSARPDLARLGTVIVEESSLGTEFSVGNPPHSLGGLLENATALAKVTALWAGSICQFR